MTDWRQELNLNLVWRDKMPGAWQCLESPSDTYRQDGDLQLAAEDGKGFLEIGQSARACTRTFGEDHHILASLESLGQFKDGSRRLPRSMMMMLLWCA